MASTRKSDLIARVPASFLQDLPPARITKVQYRNYNVLLTVQKFGTQTSSTTPSGSLGFKTRLLYHYGLGVMGLGVL